MCGRYITPQQADIERHWGLSLSTDFSQSFNFAPSQRGPVIRVDEAGNSRADLLTWGFQPSWAKRAWINARSETVFESKAFAPAARKRRCLVPSIGWYEWHGSRAPKQPYVFHMNGFVPFAFAGIWTVRDTEDGPIGSYAILTKPASESLQWIHGRMPVMLDADSERVWMDSATPMVDARALLDQEYGPVNTYAVSTFVNKPANNSAECIAPMETSGQP